jgi:hypothetical protein
MAAGSSQIFYEGKTGFVFTWILHRWIIFHDCPKDGFHYSVSQDKLKLNGHSV